MKPAKRIAQLPPYLFARIDELIEKKKAEGVDVISLGIGDPVEPTPQPIIDALNEALKDPENHRYPSYYGLREFRISASLWFKKRFRVELDPDNEILPLIGSKEGIAHLPWALVDEGDIVLVPDPAYPVYEIASMLSSATPYKMPLLKENGFLPDLDSIPSDVLRRAKLMFINYPNNPTTAVATDEFFKKAIELAHKYGFLIAHDNAYSEITFNGYKAPSILEFEGAKEVCVEFHSLSKSFNMTGWRIGFLAGNANSVKYLANLKTNIDSGIFNPIQYSGIKALTDLSDFPEKMCLIYERRKQMVLDVLNELGISYHISPATIYVWAEVPDGYTSDTWAMKLIDEAGIVVSPGSAYGKFGEGYFRISLTVKDERLKEAMERLKNLK
ncbi:MAG: LL-diaminopimelate aminotransferase [Actinobacteria bacterium]|nr:LL-diaminopimelate aminotransferase [Actinomycetota bacterium]